MQSFITIQQPLLGLKQKAWKSAVIFPEGEVIFPEERGYIPRIVRLYSRKSMVILPGVCGYIPRRASYCRKSPVIWRKNTVILMQ